jgi:hypothetical protein
MNYQEIKELVSSLETSEFEFPTRLMDDELIFLSKLNGLFSISYPDKRTQDGNTKKHNLTSSEVLRIIKNKINKYKSWK